MSVARTAILSRIRASQAARGSAPDAISVDARIERHASNLIPARGLLRGDALVTQFSQFLVKAMASVASVPTAQDVPRAIAEFMSANKMSGPIRLSGDAMLASMPWDRIALYAPCTGDVCESDMAGVSVALCGIAETATLMLYSGPHAASGLNFLPPAHIVVVRASDIVGALEDGWARLRQACNGQMPRTVNLITGPSRTADIAQTMYMGAHGPKHLHVILVEKDD